MTIDRAQSSAVCRILLVEDDQPVRDRLESILRQWSGGELVAA